MRKKPADPRKAVAAKFMELLGNAKTKAETRPVGDTKLLEFMMSNAAGYFGVSPTVVPQRIRKVQSETIHA